MLRLQSGFELDYANIYNESCIQERDVNNFERAIQNVWRHTNILRSTACCGILIMVYYENLESRTA